MSTMNCIDNLTAIVARAALADRDAVRVPYICNISGKAEEILIISPHMAERVVVASGGMVDVTEARALAPLALTPLCVRDVAELNRIPDQKAASILDDLAKRDIVTSREFLGLIYFKLKAGVIKTQLQSIAKNAALA